MAVPRAMTWPVSCKRRAADKRLDRRNTVQPADVKQGRNRQLVAKGDLDGLAAPESEFGSLQGPDRRRGGIRAQREALGPGLERQRRPALRLALGEACRGPGGGKRHRAQPGHQRASVQSGCLAGFGACHRTDADHFWECLSSCGALPRTCQKSPFFCCGPVGSCYKPAARGIAAGLDAFTRAWRNW